MNNNIEKLKKFLIEKGIDEKELNSYLFDIEKDLKDKKYGLVWEEKEEEVAKLLKNKYPVLKEITEREIKTDINKPTNLLIEGDNLLALNSLLATHKNSVNICYIDPPYNTGNKDFKYNDKFVDKEDSWKHSQWLSFMNKRLELVKELLADDGIIFISIDNYEQASLKLLCDKIFGEENFISNLLWINNLKGRQIDRLLANVNEYILCYAKNISLVAFNKNEISDENILIKYNQEDNISKYTKGVVLYNTNSKFNIETRQNLVYSIYYNPLTDECICIDEKYEKDGVLYLPEENLLGEEFIKIVPPIRNTNNKRGCWRWGMDKFRNEYKTEIMIVKDNKGNYMAHTKDRLSTDGIKLNKYKNLIMDISSTAGTSELTNIFNDKIFDYPKPTKLIKLLLNMVSDKNSLILDFFAGSGTTGHAVLDLNNEDGGNRQFILCTNNESNICEEVTYQRLNKVINGYTTPKSKEVEGLGGNLKYYQCDTVDKHSNEEANNTLLIENMTEMIKIKSNSFEILEETDAYVITQGIDKVTAIIKNNYVTEDTINSLSKKLLSYEHKTKELYTNIELESIDTYDNINYYKIPKELMK